MRWGVVAAILLVSVLAACSSVPSDCARMTDPVDRDTCILSAAIAENDSAACGGIVNENWQVWCYSDVAVNIRDAKVCEKISAAMPKEHCIKEVAQASADTTLCSLINATVAGDECWRVLSVLTSTSYCANLAALPQRNRCFDDLSRTTLDYRHCSGIEQDTEKRDSCLVRVSLKTDSLAACAEIFTPYTAEVCYINQAIQRLDEKICESIVSSRVREQCVNAVALARERSNETQE